MICAQAIGLLQDDQAHGQNPQQGGDRDQVFSQVADPGEDDGHPQHHDGAPGADQFIAAEKQVEEVAGQQPQEGSQDHGDGDTGQVPEDTALDPLEETQELREDDDGKDVVQGRASQDEGGNPLLGAFTLLHEVNHHGHHHRGGDGTDNGSQHGGLQPGEVEQVHGRQAHRGDFAAGRDKAHEQGRTGGAIQRLPAQGEAGPEQDDNESDFAEIRRHCHHFRLQEPQDMRPHQDSHQEHAHQARHFQAAEEVIGSQTQNDDQGQTDGHQGLLQQGQRGSLDPANKKKLLNPMG